MLKIKTKIIVHYLPCFSFVLTMKKKGIPPASSKKKSNDQDLTSVNYFWQGATEIKVNSSKWTEKKDIYLQINYKRKKNLLFSGQPYLQKQLFLPCAISCIVFHSFMIMIGSQFGTIYDEMYFH